MKLFYAPGLCSQAPHILFREAGLAVELVLVDTASKTYGDGQDYLAINGNGYVPALQFDDGSVLTEGPAIMQWIADQAPASGLAPAAGTRGRYRLMQWLNFITAEIHKGFSPLFNPKTPEAAKPVILELLGKRLDVVERALSESPFLLGDTFTAADAYLFVVSGWAPYVGLSLDRWPALKAFRSLVARRPAVRAALQAEAPVAA